MCVRSVGAARWEYAAGPFPGACRRGDVVELGKKIDYAAVRAKGKVKEMFGKATRNDRLEAEGKADQMKAKLRRATTKIKGAIKDVLD